MINGDTISLEDFKSIAKHSGLHLTDVELESLRPLYEHTMEERTILGNIELGATDLATIFIPDTNVIS